MVKKGLIVTVASWGAALLLVVIMSSLQAPATDAAACNEGTDAGGRLAPGQSVEYQAVFCSSPEDSLVGWVSWGKKASADRNLAVVVTSPSGVQFVFDDGPSSSQTFIVFGPLEEGTWTVDVINTGSRAVSYTLQMAFG